MKNQYKTSKMKWFIWSIMAVAFFLSLFYRYVPGVMADNLIRDLQMSQYQVSVLSSLVFFTYGIMQIPIGILADYIGPGITTSVCMMITAIGSITFGFCNNVYFAYLGMLLIGIGVSAVFISTLKIQTMWFNEDEFPLVASLTVTAGNVGGLMATTPYAILIMFLGWRKSLIALGIVAILVAFLVYKIVYKLTPPKNKIDLKSDTHDSLINVLINVITNPYTWPGMCILFGVMGTLMSLSSRWGVTYIIHVYELSKNIASQFILISTMAVIVGGPIIGYITSKVGVKKIINIGTLISTLSWGLFIFYWKCKPPIYILCIFFFIMSFSSISAIQTYTNVKDVNNPKYSGIATSVVNSFIALGVPIITLLVNYILSKSWDGSLINGTPIYSQEAFKNAFSIYFILSLFGFLSSLFIKENENIKYIKKAA